jgi:hypothetical protein
MCWKKSAGWVGQHQISKCLRCRRAVQSCKHVSQQFYGSTVAFLEPYIAEEELIVLTAFHNSRIPLGVLQQSTADCHCA